MSSLAMLRLASRSSTTTTPPFLLRTSNVAKRLPPIIAATGSMSAMTPVVGCRTTTRASSSQMGHEEETFDEFNARYEKEFDNVQDVFELQRNLNNAFAYDLVPSTSVIIAALKAARRVNDFPTAVRIFEGVKAKVENKNQYREYLDELKEFRDELGVPLKEEMYPDLP